MALTHRRRRIIAVAPTSKTQKLCHALIERRQQATTWLRGGSARRSLPGRGRFDDYFEDFTATPLEHSTGKHGTHNPVWLTNTDNVLVSEGAGVGMQQRPSREGQAVQPPRASTTTTHPQRGQTIQEAQHPVRLHTARDRPTHTTRAEQEEPPLKQEEAEEEEEASITNIKDLPPVTVEVEEGPGGLPADFDWRHYVRMYPDLPRTGVTSESMASGHFANSGFREGRLQHLPPLYIEYTACMNVWDQLYSHVAAMALALELRAQVVLPPALAKNRQGRWVPYPLETLLAVADMVTAAKAHALALWQAPKTSLKRGGLPPFHEADFNPDTAYPWFRLDPRIPDHDVLTFGNFFHARRSMADIVDEVVQRIGSKAVLEYQANKRDRQVHRALLLRLPCTAFAIEDATYAVLALPTIQHAASLLRIPQELRTLADRAAAQLLQRAKATSFNGVVIASHEDMMVFTTKKQPTVWVKFQQAMVEAFNSTALPCYLGVQELQELRQPDVQKALKERLVTGKPALCKGGIFSRLDVVSSAVLDALHSEQHTLLDALVLVNAAHVAVNSRAVVGVFIDEWPTLQGLPTRPTVVRVHTRAGARDDRMSDPWVPSALLTARRAPRNASTQGLYEFLPADALSTLREEEEEVASLPEGESVGSKAEDEVQGPVSTEGEQPEQGSMLSRLLNRSWWRGRGGQQQHRARKALPTSVRSSVAQAPGSEELGATMMRNTTTNKGPSRDDAVDGGVEPISGGEEGDDQEGKAFWEEDEEPVTTRRPVTSTRTVGIGDEDEDRAATRTVPVHMAYDDDGDDDPVE